MVPFWMLSSSISPGSRKFTKRDSIIGLNVASFVLRSWPLSDLVDCLQEAGTTALEREKISWASVIGDVENIGFVQKELPCVQINIIGTAQDTKVKRSVLEADVWPYIRKLCHTMVRSSWRRLGLHFVGTAHNSAVKLFLKVIFNRGNPVPRWRSIEALRVLDARCFVVKVTCICGYKSSAASGPESFGSMPIGGQLAHACKPRLGPSLTRRYNT